MLPYTCNQIHSSTWLRYDLTTILRAVAHLPEKPKAKRTRPPKDNASVKFLSNSRVLYHCCVLKNGTTVYFLQKSEYRTDFIFVGPEQGVSVNGDSIRISVSELSNVIE